MAKAMYRVMFGPHEPNLSVRVASQQAIGSGKRIFGYFKCTRFDIDGDYLNPCCLLLSEDVVARKFRCPAGYALLCCNAVALLT